MTTPGVLSCLLLLVPALSAQTTPEVIAFNHAEVSSLSHGFCNPPAVTASPGTGVTTFTLAVPCSNNITITGTVTVTFPSGPLTGMKIAAGGKPVFQLSSPPSAEFNVSIDTNATSLPRWTVSATPGVDYVGTPEFNACRPTGVSSPCSVPYLHYAADYTLTDNPYFLARVVLTSPNSDILQYDIKIFFSASREGMIDMEVVQVVQDAQSTVPLIAGKPALLRAFIRMSSEVPGMTATVRARLGDNELSNSPIVRKFKAPTAFNRNDGAGSENFELPPEWLGEGLVTLSVELKLPDGMTPGSNFVSRIDQAFRFRRGRQDFTIGLIPFCRCLEGGETRPNLTLMLKSGEVLRKLYPIDPDKLTVTQVSVPSQRWTTDVTGNFSDSGVRSHTQKLYDVSIGKAYDQVVAYFPTLPYWGYRGLADPKGGRWFGRGIVLVVTEQIVGSGPGDPNSVEETGTVLAHEVAHNLGRPHTNNWILFDRPGWCPDVAFTTDFPYSTPGIQEPGWDSAKKEVQEPAAWYDLMSYCGSRWISPFNYRKLFEGELLPRRAGPVSAGVPAEKQPSPAASGEDIVIGGMVRKDGGPGRLDPVYRVPSDGKEEPSLTSGASHCLRFSGAGGAPLGDHCFLVPFENEDYRKLDVEYFTLKVPLPIGVTRVALLAGNTEVASLSSSSAPPSLTITAPKAGDRWDGGTRTIAWTASSKDGKPLTYGVLYSADAGKTWLPVVLDIKDSQHTFDTAEIEGGKDVRFRVMASDGLDSTTVEVGPLDLAQSAKASLSVPTLDFGTAAVDQTVSRTFTIANTGNGPLKIDAHTLDQPDLKITVGRAPLLIAAGQSADVTVQWLPHAAGTLSGTLKIASNDPGSPTVVTLNGRSEVATTCAFSLSANSGSYPASGGNSAVDLSATMPGCDWTASTSDGWIRIAGAGKGKGSGRVNFSVLTNPTTSARSGSLTIAGRGYTVSQAPGAANLGGGNAVLQADGGTFTQAVGYPAGKGNVYFVVRLTPATYPATLNAVQIYFGKRADGLAQGAAISILAGSTLAGSTSAATLDGVSLARNSGTVGVLDGFNVYSVAPQTINSGDFVVGFAVDNARGILPADQDATSGSQRRSYVSPNGGASYISLDTVPGVAGNLAIRATATVGRSSVQ